MRSVNNDEFGNYANNNNTFYDKENAQDVSE